MSFQCEFCKNTFLSQTNLNKHKKTTRYCLKIQNKLVKYICECKKELSSKQSLARHQNSCVKVNVNRVRENIQQHVKKVEELEIKLQKQKKKYENLLCKQEEKYERKIHELQDKLENIAIRAATKSTTTTNNNNTQNIINMKPLTLDHFRDNADNLTIEHIKKGKAGYAQFALDYCADRLKVTDVNRKNVKFKSETNGVVVDKGMMAFQRMLGTGINFKNQRLIEKYIHREVEMRERAGITAYHIEQEMLPLRQQLVYIAKMAKGDQTKLGQDICKIICQKLGAQGTRELIKELGEDGDGNSELEFVVEESSDYGDYVKMCG